jgi:PAS domain S-box-containing protein
MGTFSFSSVRTRVVLLVFLVLVPIVILTGFNAWEQRRRAVEHATAQAEAIFNFAVINEQKNRMETEEVLARLTEVPEVANGGEGCSSYLSSLLKNYPRYMNFGVAQPDGGVICSAVPFGRALNIADRPYFRRALENGSFSTGQYQVGRITGKPSINFGYPVVDRNGRVSGVIFTAVDLSYVTEFEFNVTAQMPVTSTYVKLDSNGSVLNSYPASQLFGPGDSLEKSFFEKILKEKKGTFTATGTDGVERMYLFSTVWGSLFGEESYVLLGIPVKALFAESERSLSRNLAILAMVTVITILGVWFAGDKLIVRPVRVLVDVSKRLAAGDLTTRAGLSTTHGELGQLSHAFDEMAGEIEKKERNLSEMRARLGSILSTSPAIIYVCRIPGDGKPEMGHIPVFMSDKITERFGYEIREVLDHPDWWEENVHPEDLPEARARRILFEQGAMSREYRFREKGGNYRWVLDQVVLVKSAEGTPVEVVGSWTDITENKQAEMRIKRNLHMESSLRMTDASIIMGDNIDQTLQIVCDAIVKMGYRMCWVGLAEPDYTVRVAAVRGADKESLVNLGIRWDDTPQGEGASGIVIKTGRSHVSQSVLADIRSAPLRAKLIEWGLRSRASLPLKSKEGKPFGALHVYSEQEYRFSPEEIYDLETFAQQCTIALLSSRRLEELRDTSRRLAFHINRMPLGYIAYDQEFRIVGWNPAAERIFGWSADEAMGKHPFELIVPPEMQPRVSRTWSKLCEGDESSGDSTGAAIRKDGTKISCAWFNTPLRDASGTMTGLFTLVHDVTEKSKLERQLQTAQRMESVGTLAGGIAHDFNNALTGIIGYGELLRGKVAGDPGALQDLDVMMKAAERASTLTRQLLTYARRQVIDPVNLNLNTLTADLMKLIGKVTGEHIEVRTSLAKDLPTIRADRGQIEQVLMNLCLNARDAMPEGGQMLVETEEMYLDDEYVKHNPYIKVGRYALLKVSDTGIGMDEKTRERVFEPFFTTKGPEKGTGLGLAMVYGIVKQHNGYIYLYSELGQGTTFKVYFPAVEALPDVVWETRREEAVRGGTETILLAEDEESVRRLAERALKDLGYKVLVARDGEEAIEIFKRNEDIALAVLDVIMPRKGGKEAYEEMHRGNPKLKVIFMSGYTANAIHESFVLIAGVPFLPKPFGPSSLARKVREVLDSQRSPLSSFSGL